MADKTTKDTKTEDKAEEANPAETQDKLPGESSTADTSTPSAPVNDATPATPTSDSLISEAAADSAPASSPASTPATPVVVEDKEVASAAPVTSGPANEKLAEEIEVLTGEIQALEAKIEQLTSGATVSPAAPAAAPISSPDIAPIAADSPAQPAVPDRPEMPTPPTANTEPEKEFVNKPQDAVSVPIQSSTPKVSDISPKPSPMPEDSTSPEPLNADKPENNSSGLAIIGEVVAVFGIIIFIVLAMSPFFRETIGEDTYQAVQQIGWLSALGTLSLGFLLLVFIKGKGLFKWLLFFLLLIAVVLFLAINGSSLVSPIANYLDPLLSFYR